MNSLLSDWLNSLKQYLQMCLFLSTPAKLPYSPASILLTLIAYIIVGELLLGPERSLISIIVQIGTEVMILFGISFIALKISRKPQRLMQTLSALIGVSLLISLASLLTILAVDSIENGQPGNAVIQINLILLLWNLAVISLIFKRAFEIRTISAGFIAFNYFLFYEFLLVNFF